MFELRARCRCVAWVCVAVGLSAAGAFAQGYGPEESAAKMTVPEGFEVTTIAHEPDIIQPLSMEFDERGRMWVIQYIQYPNPAGLKRVKVDRWSRTVYDRIPKAPPHGPRGADKITILEDTDGDGRADKTKDFVDGLNLASGMTFGPKGIYVLQAPYLLYYPDENRDDVPDRDPDVLLTGFGMEDGHSVANSLTMGPDGWLYGNQGSTVTARIRGIEFQQGVWRYHHKTDRFELFCEGGGNMWGMDFDASGNLFSSTNFGPYLMLHGVQGAYYWKSFNKHGGLHNPFTYGYFDHVQHHDAIGGHVAVGGMVYQADTLPKKFKGKYIAANLLSHTVYWHDIIPKGSTFETKHGGVLLDSNDNWFAPSDLTVGPDGAIYVADWHDQRTAHPDPDAEWDRSNGRIYRIAPKQSTKDVPFDLGALSNANLVDMLANSNVWFARRARLILSTRDIADVQARLKKQVVESYEHLALESLWTLYSCGALDDSLSLKLLEHPNASLRHWAVRLLGDDGRVSDAVYQSLQRLAVMEQDVHVQTQLAATAKRLPAKQGLPIVWELLEQTNSSDDLHLPHLLWWAIEEHHTATAQNLKPLLALDGALTQDFILPRLIRRLVADGSPLTDAACLEILAAQTDTSKVSTLLESLDQGLADRGRDASDDGYTTLALFAQYAEKNKHEEEKEIEVPELSPAMKEAFVQLWESSPDDPVRLRLANRTGHKPAFTRAHSQLMNANTPTAVRLSMLEVVAKHGGEALATDMLLLVNEAKSEAVRLAALDSLAKLSDQKIPKSLAKLYPSLNSTLRQRTRQVFFGRPEWALQFLTLVDNGSIEVDDVPVTELRRIALHEDKVLDALIEKHWGRVSGGAPEEKLAEMRRLNNDVRAFPGNEMKGEKIFGQACGTCHVIFGKGNKVGPDLTQGNRMDTSYLLASLVDPNLVVRKEYKQYIVETKDGGLFNGIMVDRTPGSLTLLNAGNVRTTIAMEDVEVLEESPYSLMPEGLISQMDPQDLRDLFAFLKKKDPNEK